MAINFKISGNKCNGYQCSQPIEYGIEAIADGGQSVEIPFCEQHFRVIEAMVGDGRTLKDNEDESKFFDAPRECLTMALLQVMTPPETSH